MTRIQRMYCAAATLQNIGAASYDKAVALARSGDYARAKVYQTIAAESYRDAMVFYADTQRPDY